MADNSVFQLHTLSLNCCYGAAETFPSVVRFSLCAAFFWWGGLCVSVAHRHNHCSMLPPCGAACCRSALDTVSFDTWSRRAVEDQAEGEKGVRHVGGLIWLDRTAQFDTGMMSRIIKITKPRLARSTLQE